MKTPWRSSLPPRLATALGEGPATLDPDVDVDAAAARRLGPADEADVREGIADHQHDAPDVVPGDARDRVQVHAELVRVIQVVGPDGVRVEVEAAQVDHPGELRRVLDHDLVGRAAAREAERD